ncbi:MAG: hypothetical protein R3B99_22615 [Polyangiales bacterium]
MDLPDVGPEGMSLVRVDSLPDGDLLAGARVADLAGLEPGSRVIVVSLLDADRATVASRRVRIELERDAAVTVLIGSLCADVTCPGSGDDPDATECASGRCVPPTCSPQNPDACLPFACETSTDCTSPTDCADPICVDGECFLRPDPTRCREGERCDVVAGCALGACSEVETACVDGIDDDCDGLTDCADPDCLDVGCDDGSACTERDACSAEGICTGSAITCDDGESCTEDGCDPELGCTFTPLDVVCDDGIFCNGDDRCGDDGTCSVHGAPPCESFCNEMRRTCDACISDGDCGAPMEGAWGACNYGSTCGESGTRTRTVMTPMCMDGTCVFTPSSEQEACTRDTDGDSCGSTTTGAWSGCGGFSNACDTTGTRSRSVTTRACASGSCQARTTTQSESCSRSAPSDGTGCGSGRVCCGANNCVALTNDAHCGACRVQCPGSMVCARTPTNGYACRGCSSNAQCRAELDSRATCYTSGSSFCNCQCSSDGVCSNGGCGAGFYCWDCPGHNFCSPGGGSC